MTRIFPPYHYIFPAQGLHGLGGVSFRLSATTPYTCPTVFAAPPSLASSFNRSLLAAIGDAIGTELRAYNNFGGNRDYQSRPIDLNGAFYDGPCLEPCGTQPQLVTDLHTTPPHAHHLQCGSRTSMVGAPVAGDARLVSRSRRVIGTPPLALTPPRRCSSLGLSSPTSL